MAHTWPVPVVPIRKAARTCTVCGLRATAAKYKPTEPGEYRWGVGWSLGEEHGVVAGLRELPACQPAATPVSDGAFYDDLNRELEDPEVAADFAANAARIQATDAARNAEAGIEALRGYLGWHERTFTNTDYADTFAEYDDGGECRELTRTHLAAVADGFERLAERVDELEELGTDGYVEKVWEQAQLRNLEIRAGHFELDITEVEHLASAYVAFARTLLGDGENYSETRINYHVKIAERLEDYILTVQRTGRGKLTPHEARQRAEDERDQALERVSELESAVERARALHHRAECGNAHCELGGWCAGCDPDAVEPCAEHPWPCETVLALEPGAQLPDRFAAWVPRAVHEARIAELEAALEAARTAQIEGAA